MQRHLMCTLSVLLTFIATAAFGQTIEGHQISDNTRAYLLKNKGGSEALIVMDGCAKWTQYKGSEERSQEDGNEVLLEAVREIAWQITYTPGQHVRFFLGADANYSAEAPKQYDFGFDLSESNVMVITGLKQFPDDACEELGVRFFRLEGVAELADGSSITEFVKSNARLSELIGLD